MFRWQKTSNRETRSLDEMIFHTYYVKKKNQKKTTAYHMNLMYFKSAYPI